MKKIIKLLTCLTCLVMVFSALACNTQNTPGDQQQTEPVVDTIAGFELPHGSGIADKDYEYDYNSNLFYRNEPRIDGPDPGALYVSVDDIRQSYEYYRDSFKYTKDDGTMDWIDGWDQETFEAEYGTEQDWIDQYGNMYYVTVTSHGNTTSATNAKYNANMGGYRMYSSRDFVNWEITGLVDGFAIAVNTSTDWCSGLFWAPEFIRDPVTGMYFMFYGAQPNTTRGGQAGMTYPAYQSEHPTWNIRGDVAISPNPQGPYRPISTQQYFSLYAGKTQDGDFLTGTEPIVDKVTGVTYYEVYGRDGETVIGYRNGNQYYNLDGVEKTTDVPLINAGYFYTRYCTNEKKKSEFRQTALRRDIAGAENYQTEILDLNPIIDEYGDLYCYFTMDPHGSGAFGNCYGIYVMQMKDFLTPDWDTLRYVCRVGYTYVQPDEDSLYGTPMEPTTFNEGGVNEGCNVIFHEGRYYMTYSYFGYTDVRYSIGIAVSDSAYGPFVKQYQYMPVIGKGTEYNNYKGGTGHHCFVRSGDELFILYHSTNNPENNYDNNNNYLGRHLAIDIAVWKHVADLGYDMLFGNGATVNLQPKVESYTGYENVAKYATITANGDVGDVEYLNDGLFTAQPFSRIFEYGKSDGDLRITLTWDEPVTIRALMVYNSGSYYTAFNKVNSIRFKLAERPAWYMPEAYNGYCYIQNLMVDSRDVENNERVMHHGSAAIAEFNEIKVSEIQIVISGEEEDKYTDQSEDFSVFEGYKEVHVSDIYIFGNRD